MRTGDLADLREVAASRVTCRLPGRDALVDRSVPAADVPATLRDLLDQGAEDLTCAPATLEDLFLRHYEAAAR